MSENKQLTNEEIYAKLKESGKARSAGKVVELSDEQADAVSAGIGSYAVENKEEGTIDTYVCSNSETTNELFTQCLVYNMTCNYASQGARSCFNCSYLSLWGTGQKVM